MMGVGAKRAIGLYRSCAPRHPGVSKIQTECHPRSPATRPVQKHKRTQLQLRGDFR